ncbi:hypothetical protein Srubr_18890 [Streptomyces rubradiris]|uniref:YD repeat-containing protein n=1 Tax=Streptomyces rubradiris TaxID=285531 RepID=A0ABQ3R864_STRRR|nr:hypothetical protein GCM10018792_78860 [Streptomyces rubradiris]GHI52043.1 hypothetical protein Srubr_18890 [Streptomyces rubradiris]
MKSGSTTLSSISYDYSLSGKDTDKIRKRTTDGATTTYTYDTLGRLTKAVETKSGSTTAGCAYCYDKAGNRTGRSSGTSLPACDKPQHTSTYNDAGELTAYDRRPASPTTAPATKPRPPAPPAPAPTRTGPRTPNSPPTPSPARPPATPTPASTTPSASPATAPPSPTPPSAPPDRPSPAPRPVSSASPRAPWWP